MITTSRAIQWPPFNNHTKTKHSNNCWGLFLTTKVCLKVKILINISLFSYLLGEQGRALSGWDVGDTRGYPDVLTFLHSTVFLSVHNWVFLTGVPVNSCNKPGRTAKLEREWVWCMNTQYIGQPWVIGGKEKKISYWDKIFPQGCNKRLKLKKHMDPVSLLDNQKLI